MSKKQYKELEKNKIDDTYRCPKCGVLINELTNEQTGVMTYEMYAYNGEIVYDDSDFEPDNKIYHWICSRCGHVITDNSDLASLYLQHNYKLVND